MGELVDWGFSHKEDQNCTNCGMTESESNGCCEDKQKSLTIDIEQKISDAAFQLPLFTSPHALVNPAFVLTFAYFPALIEEHPTSNAPPRSSGIAVYIRNCTFLI